MNKPCPTCGNITYKRVYMSLCRLIKDLDYQSAIEAVSGYLDRCPDACIVDQIDAFGGATVLALMFDKKYIEALDDLMKYRKDNRAKKGYKQ